MPPQLYEQQHQREEQQESSSSATMSNINSAGGGGVMEELSAVDRLTRKLLSNNIEYSLESKRATDEDCKTLVWKATLGTRKRKNPKKLTQSSSSSSFLSSSSSVHDSTSSVVGRDDEEEENGNNFFYFCTALRIQDRVDQSLLRKALREYKQLDKNDDSNNNNNLSLASIVLAETHVAESLTGFTSGTIPPFGHAVPLMLIIDPALLLCTPSRHVRTGSGDESLDLRLSVDALIQFAQQTSHVIARPFTQEGAEAYHEFLANPPRQEGAKPWIRDLLLLSPQTPNRGTTSLSSSSSNPNVLEPSSPPSNDKAAPKGETKTRQPKPLSSTWLEKSLAKRLRDVAGREDYHHLVQSCIDEAGDDLPVLLYGGVNGNYTKTPVHNAAWRGSTQVLDLFLQAGQRLGHDFLNIIAVGNGNYGKTPIFYALTRSREEMVAHCLDKGANLLIVNNKGQTPCSLATSHLSKELCARMYQMEEEQLRAGGVFENYRISHSDGHKYGDLDPRFDIDPDNMGDDIVDSLAEYASIRDSLPTVNGIPVGNGFRRSVRQTTNEIRSAMAAERWGKAPKLKYLINQQEQAQQQEEEESPKEESSSKKLKKQSVKTPKINLDGLETLKLEHITPELAQNVVLVDDLHSLERFSSAVDRSVAQAEESSSVRNDQTLAQHAWGVDAEWRPTSLSSRNMPVSVLQLCSPDHEIFLLDLQTLCQPSHASPDLQPCSLELFLYVVLTKLFHSVDIALVGFGIMQDLGKLAYSFPHLPCFHLFESVVDLQTVAPKALKTRRITSLQTYVASLMEKKLDKTQQCSDWAKRPLSTAQMEYAALDAAVARPLLQATLSEYAADASSSETESRFFESFPELRQIIRMQFLLTEDSYDRSIRYRVPFGHEKTQLGVRFAKQSWMTGSSSPPEEPSRIHADDSALGDSTVGGEAKSKKKTPKAQSKESRRNKKAFPLKQLSGDLDNLPPTGDLVGYTKDDCVEAILGPNVVNSMADNFALRFNRRGGIVEMSNAWLLFINFTVQAKDWKYKNTFSKEGRQINFSVDTTSGFKENDLPFLYEMGCLDESLDYVPSVKPERQILLFSRRSTDSKFMFCGRCHCLRWEKADKGKFELQLVLDDFQELVETSYADLVRQHSEKDLFSCTGSFSSSVEWYSAHGS